MSVFQYLFELSGSIDTGDVYLSWAGRHYTTISYLSVQQSKLSPRGDVDDPMALLHRGGQRPMATVHQVSLSTEGVIVLTVAKKGMK